MDPIIDDAQTPPLLSEAGPMRRDAGRRTPVRDGHATSTLIKLAVLLARQAAAEFVAGASSVNLPARAAT